MKSLTVFCNPWEKVGKKFVILEFLHSFQFKWLITNVMSAKVVWTASSYLVIREYLRKVLME